jgi:hypothetical protein
MLFASLVTTVIYLLCVRSSSWFAALAAGLLATFSVFVRGNGMALLLIGALITVFSRVGWKSKVAFAAGSIICFAGAFVAANSVGAKARDVVRSGAGELAFCMLDKTDTWRFRLEYENAYPSYVPLLRDQWQLLIRQAAKSMYHLYDWWLLPSLGPLGVFVIPGLVIWLRRPSPFRLKLALAFGATQASYIWSAQFQSFRHLLPCWVFLSFLGLHGARLLPRTISFAQNQSYRIPVRLPCIVFMVLICLLPGSVVLFKNRGLDGSKIDEPMRHCGLLLRDMAAANDRVVATRLNIAYYSRLRPVDYTAVFPEINPTAEQAVGQCREHDCRWLIWIQGHSHYEYPSLATLHVMDQLPGASLKYRDATISLWKVDLAAD